MEEYDDVISSFGKFVRIPKEYDNFTSKCIVQKILESDVYMNKIDLFNNFKYNSNPNTDFKDY